MHPIPTPQGNVRAHRTAAHVTMWSQMMRTCACTVRQEEHTPCHLLGAGPWVIGEPGAAQKRHPRPSTGTGHAWIHDGCPDSTVLWWRMCANVPLLLRWHVSPTCIVEVGVMSGAPALPRVLDKVGMQRVVERGGRRSVTLLRHVQWRSCATVGEVRQCCQTAMCHALHSQVPGGVVSPPRCLWSLCSDTPPVAPCSGASTR